MEIDELKNTWQSLENRLKGQEMLNNKLVKDMLETKSEKSLSRLINVELISMIILLILIPVIIYMISWEIQLTGYNTFMWAWMVVCILGVLWQGFKLYKLMRIDLLKTVCNNIKETNEYNIWIKKEKFGVIILSCVLFLSIAFFYQLWNVGTALWGFLICTFAVVSIIAYWSYKKIYDKNINSILKSLEELKELKEEKE